MAYRQQDHPKALTPIVKWGAGIAQWLEEHGTRDRKVAGSSPGRSGGKIFLFFFSLLQGQLSVLTLISVSVPLPCYRSRHIKDSGHSAKNARGMLQLDTHAPHVCGLCMKCRDRHGCIVYTEPAETAEVSGGTSHITTKQR